MPVDAILHSFDYALGYLREQVADVSAADMVAQPAGIVNHPAWTVGHLTLTTQQLGATVGILPWLPHDFAPRYGTGSVPVADPERYESRETALAMLADAQERMAAAVRSLDEAHLSTEFPDSAYREIFPTIRHALTQVLVGHTTYHVAQLSLWRRAMGLPRMSRSFE